MPDISVVVFQRDQWWVAQCLEYDIGAQAMSVTDVLYQLQRSLVGHIAISRKLEREPFESLPAAPKDYWEKWEGATITLQYDKVPLRTTTFAQSSKMPIADVRLAA